MTMAWQKAIGLDVPVTNFTAVADLASPNILKIRGGVAGQVLMTDGAGNLSWEDNGAGGGGGPPFLGVETDNTSIVGNGLPASPLEAARLDGGTYTRRQGSNR